MKRSSDARSRNFRTGDEWGKDDQLGAANFITPEKRKQALALAKEGLAISLEHNISQEKEVDTPSYLERTLLNVKRPASA